MAPNCAATSQARQYGVRALCINSEQDPDVVTADLSVYDERWAKQFDGVDTVIHLRRRLLAAATWGSYNSHDLTLNVYEAPVAMVTPHYLRQPNW